jgi:hypothetical protein
MSLESITRRIKFGESVAQVAASLSLTPSAIYMQLRRAGVSVRSLGSTGGTFTPLPSHSGYRINRAGQVQSCLSPRTGEQTDQWRDLSPQQGQRGAQYVMYALYADGKRCRRSVAQLLRDAFG